MKKYTICVRELIMELVLFLALGNYTNIVSASDPSPLQDFCVATNDPRKLVYVNGKFCKDPKRVKADDFYYSGIDISTDTNNTWGFNGTLVNVNKLGGLNSLGVSIGHSEFAPKGVNPPHINIRGTEIIVVLKGKLLVGFVTSNQYGNRLLTKTLNEGDVFVFPIGLIHFQVNLGNTRAAAFNVWGSQNAGTIPLPNALFGSTPRIKPSVLAKAFQVKENIIKYVQSKSFPVLD